MDLEIIPVVGRALIVCTAAFALAQTAGAAAENLDGAERLLCAPVDINTCAVGGTCSSARSRDMNLPQFITIDLARKRLATTEANSEQRQTDVDRVLEVDNHIYLQGVEQGRAYSFVIDRAQGRMTVAVARADFNLVGFGYCTPVE